MNEPSPMFLSVVQAGMPEYPRFKVADCHLRYWTGVEWVADESKGLMFASSNDACLEVQRLLKLHYGDLPVRRYRAPVFIDVHSDAAVPQDDLIRWLVRCSKLLLDTTNCGEGPTNGTLGSLTIQWGELEQVTTEDGRRTT